MNPRITSDPKIFGGKPIIRDLRISVEMVLDLMSQEMTADAILAEYPVLEPEDIAACLECAKALVACEETEIAVVGDPT